MVDTTDYRFLENKRYCQYWTNHNVDKTKPFHKSRLIYFTKSFWIWQNTLGFEVNTFINPNSDFADFEVLKITTHWPTNAETRGHLSHMKNGQDLLLDFDGDQSMFGFFEKEKVDEILKSWNLK